MKVDGKVWVVTGAGSGMGRELALELLRRGARGAAVDLGTTGLDETVRLAPAGDRLSPHVLDTTEPAAVAALPGAVVAAHGAVDGLLNNAGVIQPFVPILEIDDAAIRRVLDVNLMRTLNVGQHFLALDVERPGERLADVCSMGGFFPFPGQTVYGAS